eukprot:TRINITY_DN37985_c0_g1_i1.p1 TRINITY_DN37985_c0_g1~~TRINITY_DN37985_c0_g1_i1.p1  ORF type:complete len:313 (+),score=24.78 TRINITY_DN37985_c0_g1_i1:112-939(+)
MSLPLASAATESEGICHGSAEIGISVTNRDRERANLHSATYDWLYSGDTTDCHTLSDSNSCSQSTHSSPLAYSSSASSVAWECVMSSSMFNAHTVESTIHSSLMSHCSTPAANGTAGEPLADTLKVVQQVLDKNFGYRGLGLSAPLIEEKRFEMERIRNLANRVDDAALNARALLNLQILESDLPFEIRVRISTFFDPPPPLPDDDESDDPVRAHCVDFNMCERIWPQSWLQYPSTRSKRCLLRAEWAEAKWRRLYQQTSEGLLADAADMSTCFK